MSFYPKKIDERFREVRGVGKIADANGAGAGASFACGAFVRFFLRIETDAKQIVEAKYKSSGCGFAIAAAEVLREKIVGKNLVDLHGLDKSVLQREIENELGKFPDARSHCAEICFDALHAALADFRRFQVEEFAGERALICTCFGISEDTIEKLIAQNQLETVEEVTGACNAGGGCGSCQPLIQEFLDVFRRENI
ncbi:MAG: iron-sulfur cluster assembly scaffold protein [Acidobacteria bacterium]|nr:iron-sulfur cluster assembly scaffold protein [Acidobacteriota bacterium]